MRNFLPGCVSMVRVKTGEWRVYDPWGGVIEPYPTDRCQGLQTAVDWAILNGFALEVYGGTQRGNGDASRITCEDSLWVSASAKTHIRMVQVSLAFPFADARDGIILDSFDMANIEMVGGQLIYAGASGAIKIRPQSYFNEGNDMFKCATSSVISIGSIAIVNPATWYPEDTHGYAVIIDPTGPVTFNEIKINEINGGLRPWMLTLPPSGDGYYKPEINKVYANFPH